MQISTSCGKQAYTLWSALSLTFQLSTHLHSGVQRTSNLVILLQPGAATQDLGQPELSNGALHVSNLALRGRRRLDPLRGLAADTADHVRMRESLWGPLLGLGGESSRRGLGDSGVKRGSAAGDQEVVSASALIAGAGPAITIACPRTGEGRMGVERGSHGVERGEGIVARSRETKLSGCSRLEELNGPSDWGMKTSRRPRRRNECGRARAVVMLEEGEEEKGKRMNERMDATSSESSDRPEQEKQRLNF